jgi:hypothetical protein
VQQTADPLMRSVAGNGEYVTSLFGCCASPCAMIKAYCTICGTVWQNHYRAVTGEDINICQACMYCCCCCWPCCPPYFGHAAWTRDTIRSLRGKPIGVHYWLVDRLTYCFCFWCAVCQDTREMDDIFETCVLRPQAAIPKGSAAASGAAVVVVGAGAQPEYAAGPVVYQVT